MSNPSREELLRPTLTEEATIAAAPYSNRVLFLSGFFGGPFAAVAIIGANSYLLRRVLKDLPVLLLGLALYLGSAAFLARTVAGAKVYVWLIQNMGQRGLDFFFTLEAFIIIAAGFYLHRFEQRNSDLMGLQRPNGWIGGIICLLAGIGVQVTIDYLVR